ncbi:tRNA (adenosine(37)-N6)-threonylcarbamoyltransferase complex ATPase subunit type 1 TsaE, partial [Francisella tularensis subsp. holarctica]|nr:tRNA (adenosine(37)-N6)-threonylcarbamoyltransferase complex ATPase subunit type 1 TsaE [Francisella tularensis subsp. holarctica]
MKSILVNDEEQMYQLAKEYAQQLKTGQMIYLYGDLGAGT